MPKYNNKKPKFFDVNKLLEKEKTKHPEGLKYDVEIELEPEIGGRAVQMRVPKSIALELHFMRKLPVSLLVIGTCMIILPMFFQ